MRGDSHIINTQYITEAVYTNCYMTRLGHTNIELSSATFCQSLKGSQQHNEYDHRSTFTPNHASCCNYLGHASNSGGSTQNIPIRNSRVVDNPVSPSGTNKQHKSLICYISQQLKSFNKTIQSFITALKNKRHIIPCHKYLIPETTKTMPQSSNPGI